MTKKTGSIKLYKIEKIHLDQWYSVGKRTAIAPEKFERLSVWGHFWGQNKRTWQETGHILNERTEYDKRCE